MELQDARELLSRHEYTTKAQKNRILSLEVELSHLRKEYETMSNRVNEELQGDTPRRSSLLQEIAHLKDMQSLFNRNRANKMKLEMGTLCLTDSDIRDALRIIERRITDACIPMVPLFSPPGDVQFELSKAEYVGSLIRRISGMATNQFVEFVQENGLEKEVLLRSIAAASVCVFALESDFPNFLAKDALLEKYRELILTEGRSCLGKVCVCRHELLLTAIN